MAQYNATGEVAAAFPLKILTIGDSAVGKTCLIMRFTGEDFVSSFITTVGIGKFVAIQKFLLFLLLGQLTNLYFFYCSPQKQLHLDVGLMFTHLHRL